jgi:methyl coenzyme M reductase subunit C
MPAFLVTVLGGVVLWSNHQTTAFPGAPVYGLHNVDELLLVLQGPVDLVVVSSPEINHDVLVPEEEHHCRRVVQLIHGVEIRDLCDVNKVDDRKVLYGLSYCC